MIYNTKCIIYITCYMMYITYHIYVLKCIEYINSICQILYITLIVYHMYYILNFYILEAHFRTRLNKGRINQNSAKCANKGS